MCRHVCFALFMGSYNNRVSNEREKRTEADQVEKKISLNIWTAQCYFSWKMFIIFGTFSSIVRCTALRKQFILCNLTALFDKWLCSQLRRPNVIFRQLFRPGQPDWTFIMPFFEFFARTFFSYSAAAAATAASSIHFFPANFIIYINLKFMGLCRNMQRRWNWISMLTNYSAH